jgi:hypothetical protein
MSESAGDALERRAPAYELVCRSRPRSRRPGTTIAFALVSAAVLVVLWPRHDWEFGASAADLIAAYVEPEPLPLPLMHRGLALHRARSRARNAAQLRWLFRAFRLGLVSLLVEVGAWLVALTEHT